MLLRLLGYATLGILVAIAVKIAIVLDLNKRVYNHRPGPCRTVEGIQYGAEDVELVERLNSAFITSGLFYMTKRSPDSKGQIFLYNFAQPQGKHKAIPLKIEGDFDEGNFHPHGLSSVIVDGQIHLYVINHDRAFKHSVEVFSYDERETTLKHVKSIKDNKFIRPNDLVALGKDQFVLTNDGSGQSAFLNMLEAISGVKAGSVIFYDSERSHTLIRSDVSPNGIAIDASRKHLFIASPVARKLTVYKLAENYKSVEPISTVDLYTSPDNLHIDETDALWIGAHPIVRELIAHSKSPDDLQISAPSQVLRVVFEPDFKRWTITEPYMNDGSELVASTVAVPYYGQLLIGSIYRTLLHCDIAHSSVL